MAEDNIDIEVTGFQSLRAQIIEAKIEMQKLAAAGKEGTEEYIRASAKVGKLKDELGDAADTAAALGTAAGKFGAVTKALSTVAGGFTAIQGAIGLAGGDAKEFEKTMVKVQSAMALSTGLAQLSEMGDSFGNLKKVAVDAFAAMKAGIGSTGIGALVLVLGSLYLAWQRQTEILKKAREEAALLNNITEEGNKLKDQEIEKIGPLLSAVKQENISRQDRVKALKEIQKQYPDYLKNQNLDKVSIDQIKQANENLIVSIGKRAKAQASMDALGKNYAKQIELELKLENTKVDVVKRRNELSATLSPGDVEKQIKVEQNVGELAQKTLKIELDKLKVQEQKINNYITEKGLTDELVEGAGAKGEAEVKAAKKEIDTKKELRESRRKLDEAEATEGEDLITTRYANELDRLKEARDKELEQEELTDKQKLEIQETYDNNSKTLELNRQKEVTKYRNEKEKERADKEKKDKDDREAAVKDEYEKTKGYTEEYFNEQREKAVKNGDDLNAIEVARLKKKIKDEEDYNHDASALKLQLADLQKKIDDEQAAEDEKKRLKKNEDIQASLNAASTLISSIASLEQNALAESLKNDKLSNKEKEKLAKESFDKQKKLQYALAVIDGAKTVTSILAQYPKFDGGIAMAAALIAAGITTGAALLKIKQTTFDSSPYQDKPATEKAGPGSTYAAGGILQGPSHDMGGIRTAMGELEGGEFVVNRRATMNFLPLLNQINASGQTPAAETTNPQQPIIKTYVVASDMTSQQEANAKLSALARL